MEKNLKTLKKLDWFFIAAGLFELFAVVFISTSFWGMILGLITLIPAYIALNEKNINWNYFVSIWAMIKYNPITLLALVAFIAGDFFRANKKASSGEETMGWDTIVAMAIAVCFFLIMVASFVLGVILLVKTIKHFKLKRIEI